MFTNATREFTRPLPMLLQGVRVMVAVAEKKKKVEGLVAESVGEQ